MVNICIVEDNADNLSLLKKCINKFGKENKIDFAVDSFEDGLGFLDAYTPKYSLVFLDIQLPNIDGIEVAHRLRKIDKKVGIIFVTNLLKYAIKGYEVQAFDYIVKPVNYFDFSSRLKKFMEYFADFESEEITLSSGGQLYRLDIKDVRYVDIDGHNIIYHTAGRDIDVRGSLGDAEKELNEDFIRCNSGILVNLNYVESVDKYSVRLKGGVVLPLSRPKKKEFMEAVTKFIAKA